MGASNGTRAGRLSARPSPPSRPGGGPPAGTRELRVGDSAAGLLHLPAAGAGGEPPGLVVLLHGAGSRAGRALDLLREHADAAGLVLLAPQSLTATWDVIAGGYGRDVATLDALLHATFGMVAVDPARVAIGGFSDGASYALSLGLTNGDLFQRIVAFSPGFMAPGPPHGRPAAFVSHGVVDQVLPIGRCSRRIVPALRAAGHHVEYREFPGGHVVPPQIAAEAVDWLRVS